MYCFGVRTGHICKSSQGRLSLDYKNSYTGELPTNILIPAYRYRLPRSRAYRYRLALARSYRYR